MTINILNMTGKTVDKALEAINEIISDLCFEINDNGDEVQLHRCDAGFRIEKRSGKTSVYYSTTTSLLRAFSALKEYFSEDEFVLNENPAFESVGVMVDCSRNSVLTVDSIKRLCRIMALMGHNTLMLYTEDTYEIEEQPYFGYMRGRYSRQELKACDEYAAKLGIEVVPCIQTLAHLNAIFRWDKFKPLNDYGDILLAEDEGTYALIDQMLSTMSANLKSRKIHIGMDEAHMLGLGQYLSRNGYKNRTQIMLKHLSRVVALCKKYNYQPIMWSDMFFRLKDRDYYDLSTVIEQDVIDLVPPEVALTYWDYYHVDIETFDTLIKKHQKFNNEIWFAGGTWSWHGILPLNSYGLATNRPALEAIRNNGVKHAFVTSWGDNGGECSIFAVLPSLQMYAEACWSGDTTDENIAKKMKISCDMDFESCMTLELPHKLPGSNTGAQSSENPATYLLFQDVMMGLFDRYVRTGSRNFYAECTAILEKEREKNPRWSYLFDAAIAISKVLEIKVELGVDLKKAYDEKNHELLNEIANDSIPHLITRVTKLHETIQANWLHDFKVFGLEVQDIRFGGLKQRLITSANRINQYLNKTLDRLDELEENRILYSVNSNAENPLFFPHQNWAMSVTTNNI